MIAPSPNRPFFHVALLTLLVSAPWLAGCGNESGGDGRPPDTLAVGQDAPSVSGARQLTNRYLALSYKGASLRSTHPLNDSLLAVRAGRGGGGPVVLVDTFKVELDVISRADSGYTVQVHVPHALTVSKVWETSTPQTDQTFSLRINDREVSKAPRIVGWPALRRHILRVEPTAGEDIIERLQSRWATVTEKQPST